MNKPKDISVTHLETIAGGADDVFVNPMGGAYRRNDDGSISALTASEYGSHMSELWSERFGAVRDAVSAGYDAASNAVSNAYGAARDAVERYVSSPSEEAPTHFDDAADFASHGTDGSTGALGPGEGADEPS